MRAAGRRAIRECIQDRRALDGAPRDIPDGVVTRNQRETAVAEIADGAMMGTRSRVVGVAREEDLGRETRCITFL